MNYIKLKKRVKQIAAIGLASVLVAGMMAGCAAARGVDIKTYRAEGAVSALYLAPPTDLTSEEAVRAYFDEAASFAKEQGCSTLVFEAKDDITTWWRDKIFPPAEGLTELDSGKSEFDPLVVLSEVLEGQEIQLWVSLSPYSAAGVSSQMEGSAAQLAQKSGSSFVEFDPSDTDYRKLLVEGVAGLAKYYPVAGVVLSGLSYGGDSWLEAFEGTLDTLKAELGEDTTLAVEMGDAEKGLDPSFVSQWVAHGKADYLIPTVGAGQRIISRIDEYGIYNNSLILDESFTDNDPSGAVLFTASRMESYAGALFGRYPDIAEDTGRIAFLQSTMAEAEGTLPEGFAIPQTLAVNYPLESDAIGSAQESVFVMGTSDPAKALTLNGEEVERHTENGVFGVLVTLEPGENKLVFKQGDEKLTHTINRGSATSGGGSGGTTTGGGTAVTEDNTKEAEEGQAVQVTGVFTGALTDPNDESAINETLYGGAVAVVQESTRVVRYDSSVGRNLNSWAYKLTSGDWVAATNVAWIDEDGKSAFTGLSAEKDDIGEWITFEGKGTPAVTISCKENVLSVSMWDTTFKLAGGFSSEFVESASVEKIDDGNGVRLDLNVSGIWGYTVDYTDGNTRLFLKSAPQLSGDSQKPLTGTRVMLDAGHGDNDNGAAGIMGSAQGPNEKDANLAQAQAIAYRLRQLGAEVIMLRDDDTPNYTTQERLGMLIEEKPDFFISVHHNSAYLTSDLNNVSGLQVYYHIPSGYTAPRSGQFGQQLMDAISEANRREASDAAYGYFNVTRTPLCPAVLFEYGFMVNPAEFEGILSSDGLWATACGTVEGIYSMVAGQGTATDNDPNASDGAEQSTSVLEDETQ